VKSGLSAPKQNRAVVMPPPDTIIDQGQYLLSQDGIQA
jgi:hypothetical protein